MVACCGLLIWFVVHSGCLVATKCRAEVLDNMSIDVIDVSNASLTKSKIAVQYCIKRYCETAGAACYCCLNQKPEVVCYKREDDCKSICPKCNPICRPQTPRGIRALDLSSH
ncbi:hypothetical protein EJB05_37100, partial [Eragrostis curvula]